MGWKPRNLKDPIEKRRRDLEQQSVALSRQKAALEAELQARNIDPSEMELELKPSVWIPKDEGSFTKEEEPFSRSTRPRVLSVQRYRDRNVFIVLALVLLVIVSLLIRATIC